MITKDGKDVQVEKLTKDNYLVPKGEERAYHVLQEIKQFDPKTGAKLSKPRVQKYGKKIFESIVLPKLRRQGYELTILHDPTEYLKAQAEILTKQRIEAEAKKKAEEEARFQAAVAAEVAKQLAAMKEQETKEKPKK